MAVFNFPNLLDILLELWYFARAMSKYIITNNQIRVAPDGAISVVDKIPTATYVVDQDPQTHELFLVPMDSFTYSGKIYGDVMPVVDRIINTYEDRKSNLGVLLSGIKGSGKSLTIKILSRRAMEMLDIPTIVISRAFNSNHLAQFLYTINMRCVVFFDEFDKNYSSMGMNGKTNTDDQHGLLDLLDGVFASDKLFIFCANRRYAINEYMQHRPGRVFYHFKYEQLTPEVVSEYLDDNLKNPEFKQEIMMYTKFIPFLTFDILKAIVEESNRYNEPVYKFIDMLNIDCNFFNSYMDVVVYNSKGVAVQRSEEVKVEPGKSYDFWTVDETLINDAGLKRGGDGEACVELIFDPAMLRRVNNDGSFELYDSARKVRMEFKKPYVYSGYKSSAIGAMAYAGELEPCDAVVKSNSDLEAKQAVLRSILAVHSDLTKTFSNHYLFKMVNDPNMGVKEFSEVLHNMIERLATRKAYHEMSEGDDVPFGESEEEES